MAAVATVTSGIPRVARHLKASTSPDSVQGEVSPTSSKTSLATWGIIANPIANTLLVVRAPAR